MADLPSGTVTFLFTDIDGSTRLLTQLGQHYSNVLSAHRQLLEACFEEAGGHVVDTQGDAFFVAFRRATDAVGAAVAAQEALARHRWPAGGEPRVRMGIDTGEPSLIDVGFVGLTVHRAARICSAGHGGQVLLSRTARDLAEDSLPSGVLLRDLGEHRLKDLERAEPISQLVVEGLASSFPPLRTLESQPVEATPFAGQEDKLAAAAEAALRQPTGAGHSEPLRRRPASTGRLRRPRRWSWRRSGSPMNTLEGLGFRAYSMARIAPREDLQTAVRSLGSTIVAAAQLARDSDRLLRETDRKALARQLADQRDSAHIAERHLRAADALALRIAAVDALAEARRAFDEGVTELESTVAAVRSQLFDVRIDPVGIDDLLHEVESHKEHVDDLTTTLRDPYARASARSLPPAAPEHRAEPEDGIAGPDVGGFEEASRPGEPADRIIGGPTVRLSTTEDGEGDGALPI